MVERIEIIPSPVPNTSCFGIQKDGVLAWYEIVPNEGYLLHNKVRDYIDIDPETRIETPRLGYGETPSSCPLTYKFTPVTVTDENGTTFTAYGQFELFARLKSEVE